jgi:hypothetical protein
MIMGSNSWGRALSKPDARRIDAHPNRRVKACGYRWPSADDAIHYALNRARQRIRQAFAFADLLPQGRESAFSLWWDSTTKHPRKADRHLPPAFLHGQ